MVNADWFGAYAPLIERWLPYGIGGAALLILLRGLNRMLAKTSIRITPERVRFERRAIIGSTSWEEPLRSYRGVRWKRFVFAQNRSSGGQRRAPRYRNVIELAHENPERSVPLVVYISGRANAAATLALAKAAFSNPNPSAQEKAEMEQAAEELARESRGDHLRETWESLAARLNLPAIDGRDGGESIREVEDLDKTVRELADEGRLESNWSYSPPPEPLAIEPVGEGQQRILIRSPESPILIKLFGAIGAVMLVLGMINLNFGLAFAGLLFGGFPVLMIFIARSNPRSLTIADGQLTHENPNRKRGNFRIDLAAIESIELRTVGADTTNAAAAKLNGKQLRISSDQGDYTAGAGLKPDALEWLRGYLLDAAKKA